MLVHIFNRSCFTDIQFGLTQDIVAVCENFAVHKQVTRADLHWWNYHNGAATCMGIAAVRAPVDRKHSVKEKVTSNLQASWNICSWKFHVSNPGKSHNVVVLDYSFI